MRTTAVRRLATADASPRRQKEYTLTARATGAAGSGVVAKTASGHTIESGLPRASGGDDAAAEPVYHLLAALCGCEAATAAYVARRMRPRVRLLAPLVFELSAMRDERGALALPVERDPPVPARLLRVVGTVAVATDADDEQLALLERQTHRRCPVANMLVASGVDLDLSFERQR